MMQTSPALLVDFWALVRIHRPLGLQPSPRLRRTWARCGKMISRNKKVSPCPLPIPFPPLVQNNCNRPPDTAGHNGFATRNLSDVPGPSAGDRLQCRRREDRGTAVLAFDGEADIARIRRKPGLVGCELDDRASGGRILGLAHEYGRKWGQAKEVRKWERKWGQAKEVRKWGLRKWGQAECR